MIPLRDENPTRSFSFITVGLILVNVLVFLWEVRMGPALAEVFPSVALIPYRVIHFPGFSSLLTLFTSLFVHAGLLHLLGNMLYLWIFANNVEDTLGHGRFLLFYLVCGVGASVCHLAANTTSVLPTVGASGAISGVLGAYLILFPQAKVVVLLPILFFWRLVRLPALYFLGLWFLLQFFSGATESLSTRAVSSGIAWFAHIGGFLIGIIALPFFLRKGQ